MAKLSLHIGMYKTGTTTLQHMFAGRHGQNASFLAPFTEPTRINDIFSALAQQDAHREDDLPEASLDAIGERLLKEHDLRALNTRQGRFEDAEQHLRAVLSEAPDHLVISNENLASIGKVQSVTDTLLSSDRDVRALAYARGLATATIAGFQEHLHSSPGPLAAFLAHCPEHELLVRFCPRYKQTLNPWLDTLGSERFEIRAYDPLRKSGEKALIEDFSSWSGLQPLRSSPPLNVQDSAETIAITYVLLTEMASTQFAPGLFQFARAACAKFGGQKLVLRPETTRKFSNLLEVELDWIEARVGCSFHDAGGREGLAISSAVDLHDIARDLRGALCEHIEKRWRVTLQSDGSWRRFFQNFQIAALESDGSLKNAPTDFDSAKYLRANPDVALAKQNAIRHYRAYGFFERRCW